MTLLVATAGVAGFVRFWRIGWGLADGMCLPDEVFFWRDHLLAFVPWRWEAFLPAKLTYPSLFGNLAGIAFAATHALGWIDPAAPFMQALFVGRCVSALAGLATVVLAGALAGRIESSRAGLAAAALMAVVPLEAMQVHYLSVDVLLAACATASVLLSHRLLVRPSLGAAAAAGFATGLTFAAKYTGIFLLAAPGWAALEVAARSGIRNSLRVVGGVAIGAVLGAALGCPRCAVSPDRMLAAIDHHRMMTEQHFSSFYANHVVESLGWYGKPFLYQVVATLPYALGWPLYLVGLLGLAQALRRHDRGDRLVVATLLAGFLLICQSRVAFPRYVLPLVPLLVVLAARALTREGAWARSRTALAAAVWAYGLALTVSQVGRFSYDQQNAVAVRIAEAFPELARGGAEPRVAVPANFLDYQGIVRPLARIGVKRPDLAPQAWLPESPEVVVLADWVAMQARRDDPDGTAARSLDALRNGSTGYREVMHVQSSYFSEPLYTALDPAFAADLWQGEIGFRLYLRNDVAQATRASPESPPSRASAAQGDASEPVR